MLTAIDFEQYAVMAAHTHKGSGPFTCPECNAQVTLKRGRVITAHFAHRPGSMCTYGSGESELHRQTKLAIYEELKQDPRCSRVELEFSLGRVRADVAAKFGVHKVGIEVQLSALSLDQIEYRTRCYARAGWSVLWVTPLPASLYEALHYDEEDETPPRYRPRIQELWTHELQFERAYYWDADFGAGRVLPVHFSRARSWVDYAYNSEGEQVGGYFRTLKSMKRPYDGLLCDIANFRPINRVAETRGGYRLPAAKLWLDPHPDWWPSEDDD